MAMLQGEEGTGGACDDTTGVEVGEFMQVGRQFNGGVEGSPLFAVNNCCGGMQGQEAGLLRLARAMLVFIYSDVQFLE
jgi:hypothetical protein